MSHQLPGGLCVFLTTILKLPSMSQYSLRAEPGCGAVRPMAYHTYQLTFDMIASS